MLILHGDHDPGHVKSLKQALNKLEDALAKVDKHCGKFVGAAILIAGAQAAIEEPLAALAVMAVV